MAGGDVAGFDVAGFDVAGGDVTGGDVTGGDVAGADVAGGDVAVGDVAVADVAVADVAIDAVVGVGLGVVREGVVMARASATRGAGCASTRTMKILSKLFVLGGVAATAILVDRKLVRRRAMVSGGATPPSVGGPVAGVVDAEILVVGISDVDPSGLVGMGEAIDPEANAEAHEAVDEQRARMPVRGRDVP